MLKVWCALALAATPALAGGDVVQTTYRCDRGVEVPASYVNAGEISVAVIQAEGRQIALTIGMSGSGARYVTSEAGPGYVWWTKGAEASLYWQEGGQESLLLTCQEAE